LVIEDLADILDLILVDEPNLRFHIM